MAPPHKKTPRRWFRRLFRWTALTLLCLTLAGLGGAWFFYHRALSSLPEVSDLAELRPDYGTRVQAQDGTLLGGEAAIEPVPFEDLPPMLIVAFLAAEDEDFFHHRGFNTRSILRALFDNYRAGQRVQGASTISQQVAKHFLTPDRTFRRKVEELLLARRIEDQYSKEEILSAYLGGVYFGRQAWGVTQASYRYYGRAPQDLTLPQIATLAGLLPAPSVFNPLDNPHLATRERNRVLRRLHEIGVLSRDEKLALQQEPLDGLSPSRRPVSPAPEAVGTVLRRWDDLSAGRPWEASNLEVVTTHHPGFQTLARHALVDAIDAHDRRSGYRGPPGYAPDPAAFDDALDTSSAFQGHFALGRIIDADRDALTVRVPHGEARWTRDDLSWIRGEHPRTGAPRHRARPLSDLFSPDDVVYLRRPDSDSSWELWQRPDREGAFLVADLHSGEVLASVGAYEVETSRFHRAEQACRQPGSLFKTILLTEALSREVTLATLLSDVPTDVRSHDGVWQPRNADYDFRGYITALDAFAASRNIATVNLASHVGIQPLIQRARHMGVTSLLDNRPALALGASCTTVGEMLAVHAAVPRQGQRFSTHTVAHLHHRSPGRQARRPVIDRGSFTQRDPALLPRVVRAAARPEPAPQAMESTVATLMHRALRDVVTRGTAHHLPSEWPVSGKTGTSNEFDTWFVGFDPHLVAAVWIGSDQNDRAFEPGEHGGSVAVPAFAAFYEGLQDPDATWPPDHTDDADIEIVPIDPGTGLRARQGEPGVQYPFRQGSAPRALAPTRATRQLQDFDSLSF